MAGLKDGTEAVIVAAQERALGLRSIEAVVYHTSKKPKCRLYRDALEIIQHITAECKMLAGSAYIQSIQEHLCRVCACPKVKMVGENE